MKFKASVNVMLKPSVLDPQGATLERALKSMGHRNVSSIRVGKLIELTMDCENQEAAAKLADDWADKLLANPNMENYSLTLEKLP
ncbi:MAG: phosphoribosylformylglycinamidine synthase subunit PurS [Deltaproteobacteria bacterium]|jgi:phosphoribosylformylglycinamidine synthase|nr:phosphoribosylformylglycinamidine synthase subunit PurS [Deltaproteobacteria bacterium]MDR1298593.1 phosphoribosylformylglycinamidine synthase subunit PurS [Deltaproteobacteria bacterium]